MSCIYRRNAYGDAHRHIQRMTSYVHNCKRIHSLPTSLIGPISPPALTSTYKDLYSHIIITNRYIKLYRTSDMCKHQYSHIITKRCLSTGPTSTKELNRLLGMDDRFGPDREEGLMDDYEYLVQSGEVTRDPHQIRALFELDRLREECIPYLEGIANNAYTKSTEESIDDESWSMSSLFSFSPRRQLQQSSKNTNSPPKGVYLHGGVGCGKTYCMDLFYDSLPSSVGKKQKVHFHKFMLSVHKQMHKAKMIKKLQGDEVIDYVIKSILRQGKILCFDEFQVTDVADALILKRLFTGLIDNGTIIVATSNRPPDDLYKGGLQRDLFLPFIDLLEEKCEVVSMWDSDMDYRLVQSGSSGEEGIQKVYFVEGGDDDSKSSAKEKYLDLFRKLTKGAAVNSMVLDVGQGREIFVPKASEEYSIARFSFHDLCGTAKGAADYLAIGDRFHTIFVDDVPKLKYNEVNLVRRWITFIDSMYECHVKLVIHAATDPAHMFEVDLESEHDEVFAFDRTRSRMEEMRSEAYLRRKWIGKSPAKLLGVNRNPGSQKMGTLHGLPGC